MVEDRADRGYHALGQGGGFRIESRRSNSQRAASPHGHWIALPLQVYRINTLFLSAPGMERAKLTKAPATWDEFNEAATKMKAAGMTPLANGGIRWDDGMKFEIALAGIRPGCLSQRDHATG